MTRSEGARGSRFPVALTIALLLGLAGAIAWGALRGEGFATARGTSWIVLGGGAMSEAIPLLMAWSGLLGRWADDLGFRTGPRGSRTGWALAVLIAVAYCAVTIAGNPVIARHALDLVPFKALGLCAALFAGVVEELVFRRMLMEFLRRRGCGAVVQIMLSAVAFGLPHALWGVAGGSLELAIGATVATTILGAALATTYVVAGRSLAPCIAAHVAIDAVLEPWLLFAALGGS